MLQANIVCIKLCNNCLSKENKIKEIAIVNKREPSKPLKSQLLYFELVGIGDIEGLVSMTWGSFYFKSVLHVVL